MLCSAAEADLLCWLLSSAAREMHTCTLASYVITRVRLHCCTLLNAPGLGSAWLVEKFICGLGDSLGTISSFVCKKFEKVKFTTFLTP